MSDRIGTTEAREEGFYWVILGHNPPEIAYWERGEWWLAGDPRPWQAEAATVASERLVFKPRLVPVAWCPRTSVPVVLAAVLVQCSLVEHRDGRRGLTLTEFSKEADTR